MTVFRTFGMITLAMVFTLMVSGTAATHEGHGPSEKRLFTKHFEETLFDITKRASYSIEILLDEKEHKIGKDTIGMVVHDAHDEDVKGAQLTIVHKDLSTGADAPGKLSVVDKGNGLYIISGLDLKRAGKWELSITVKKDRVEDSVKFVFPDALKDRPAKGKYSP
ncbi:MAG TPA: hypothetical protein VN328_06610 [Thermodesulfovibrionales bacterium]|nr:hypothetical protein [Thermodesulfovibrionales bacterium]